MRFQDPERDADKPAACWHSAPTFVRPPCPTDAVADADAEPPTVTGRGDLALLITVWLPPPLLPGPSELLHFTETKLYHIIYVIINEHVIYIRGVYGL